MIDRISIPGESNKSFFFFSSYTGYLLRIRFVFVRFTVPFERYIYILGAGRNRQTVGSSVSASASASTCTGHNACAFVPLHLWELTWRQMLLVGGRIIHLHDFIPLDGPIPLLTSSQRR